MANVEKRLESFNWTAIRDMEHGVVLYVACLIKEYKVDTTRIDPDGVPVVHYTHELVTRVRKMTEKEIEESYEILNKEK